ncbi:hypothetical protein CXK86_20115 [Paenibacillus sp. BGI2013]|uniref:restriction endonuclease n=1 Tax=Paenibacillus sp. BGI2013 TaxID=2058902 RepID=UPI000CBD1A7E|nr:restriction endonuclease [Paenibacillus sp. BGI2013]PKQ89358.1 hypothetical protein CXK86_20115 [Paenibacillus sp. BGI2013]
MQIDIENFSDLSKVIDMFSDDFFWNPIWKDSKAISEFDKYINLIEESKGWERNRNHEKGKVLEDFAVFLFERFLDSKVSKNRRPADNETDVEVILSEKERPTFMTDYMAPRMICECKNKKSSTIDVGMVAKLYELLGYRGSKFGVFISLNGISGYGWRFGEGKRKKILLRYEVPLISFKVDELRKLRNEGNFYSMIKEKVHRLFDEADDEMPDFPNHDHRELPDRLNEMVEHFKKFNLIEESEECKIRERITVRYGLPSVEED